MDNNTFVKLSRDFRAKTQEYDCLMAENEELRHQVSELKREILRLRFKISRVNPAQVNPPHPELAGDQ